MECIHSQTLNNRDFLIRFKQKVAQHRIPAGGAVSLTYRCNLNCVHCYLGDKSAYNARIQEELNTAQWLSIIDQLAEAGCLGLIITGGEPLLRYDFPEIYTYAKNAGMLVSVFTNGVLITDEIVSLFKALPPRAVEISLYGFSADTYEKITGSRQAHEKCVSNIECLVRQGISVYLKTMLMTLNRHELKDMGKWASELGVKFYFDGCLFPRRDSREKFPIQLRVPPEEIVKNEFSTSEKIQEWTKFYNEHKGRVSDDNRLYRCGCGLTTFFIDPYGELKPCLMAEAPSFDLMSEGSFQKGWQNVIPQIRKRQASRSSSCGECKYFALCRNCPPFFERETGDEETPSPYLCELARQRYKKLYSWNKGDSK